MTDLPGDMPPETLSISSRVPRFWLFDGVLDGDGLRSRLRALRLRTTESLFADIGSDFGVFHRAYLVKQLGWRAALIVAAELAAWMTVGWTLPAWILALAMCLAMSHSLGPRLILAAIAAIVVAPFYGRYWWIPLVAVLAGALYTRQVEPVLLLGAAMRPWRPVGLLPARETFYLVRHRLRFKVTMALDLAAAGFPMRAAEDVSAILAALGPGMTGCRSMMYLLRAMIAYESDDHEQALISSGQARQWAASCGPGVRAWVDLGYSRLMAELGDATAALAAVESAARQAPRRASGLRFDADVRYGVMTAASGDRAGAIRMIHRARLQSVRDRDLLGMLTTEIALMQAADISKGIQELVVDELVQHTDALSKGAPLIPSGIVGAVESFAGELQFSRNYRKKASAHFASAVIAFERSRNVIQQALALARLAELLSGEIPGVVSAEYTAQEQMDLCLESALWAIEIFQDVRYALPTSQWRQHWIRTQARTYDLAMRVAFGIGDHAQVAALIELSKSQAVPITVDTAIPDRRNVLDVFLEARASLVAASASAGSERATSMDALRVLVSADPVHMAAPPVVAGKSALPRVAGIGTDVDAAVSAIAGPDSFYLTAAITGENYFWAFRLPDGEWFSGVREITLGGAFRDAIGDLLRALPVRLPGELESAYYARVTYSALNEENTEAARTAESALMKAVGRAIIPAELFRELRGRFETGGPLPKLVVSMPGALSAIPVAFVGIHQDDDDTRLIEIADIQVLPSIEMVNQVGPGSGPGASAEWPLRVAGNFPVANSDEAALDGAKAQPGAQVVIDVRVDQNERKEKLLSALFADGSRAATSFLRGHMRSAREGGAADPMRQGLQLAWAAVEPAGDGTHLTVRDLLDGAAASRSPMSERIVVLACSTLGMVVSGDPHGADVATPTGPSQWPLAGEWVGFSAACLLAGARVVVCTHFDQINDPEATALDYPITRMLTEAQDPVHGLADILRRALKAWRDGLPGAALSHLCYTIISV